MENKILSLVYTNKGPTITYHAQQDLTEDDFIGLYENIFFKIIDDFFDFEDEDDYRNSSLSMLMDLHYLIDGYALAPEKYSQLINQYDKEGHNYECCLYYNDSKSLLIDFEGTIGPAEVLSALALMMVTSLTREIINETLINITYSIMNVPDIQEMTIN